MKRYTVGLQLFTDQALYPRYIKAENSDEAWKIGQKSFKDRGFNEAELTTMVLYNEKELS